MNGWLEGTYLWGAGDGADERTISGLKGRCNIKRIQEMDESFCVKSYKCKEPKNQLIPASEIKMMRNILTENADTHRPD